MRWVVLLLAFAIVPSALAVTWGCCIPPTGVCFNGDAYPTEQAFRSACGSGSVLKPNVASCAGFVECQLGCCCAEDDVIGSTQINSNEANLNMTRYACTVKNQTSMQNNEGHFTWNARPQGISCPEVCGQDPGTGGGETYSISGKILNGTAAPAVPIANVEVFIPVPGGSISTMTAADGTYTLEDVPRINGYVFAIHDGCRPGQSNNLIIDSDKTGIDLTLNCLLTPCVRKAPQLVRINLTKGTNHSEVTVAIDNNCEDFVQYEPKRCKAQFLDCRALPPQVSPAIVDIGLENNTQYCYNITARFGDGQVTSLADASTCITTGDAACMNLAQDAPERWCGIAQGTPAIVSCDAQNKLTTVQACEQGKYCSTASGEPLCVDAPACSQCNGLAGLFAKLGLTIGVGGIDKECGNDAELPQCFEDASLNGNPVLDTAFTSCSEVANCQDYMSESVCGDNPCAIADTCSWTVVAAELGKGICMGTQRPPCDQCEEVLGFCTKEACEAISQDCYYDAEKNGLSVALGCIDKSTLACRYYDTQADCVGTTGDAVFDIAYTGDDRTGTTHVRTTASDDVQGIGSCTWVADRTRCVKNADMKWISQEDDCIENNKYQSNPACVRDSTPPTTTFYLRDPAVYGVGASKNLPFGVVEDMSPTDKVKTFVCYAPLASASASIPAPGASGSCYPTTQMAAIQPPAKGAYALYYYSMDEHGNIEPVAAFPRPIVFEDYGLATFITTNVLPTT